jgi:phosphopantothenoylcysteine decarboxylase / phosphopantothenate---cysteine ligase
VAEAAARRGAKVILVSGPTALETPLGVRRVDVRTAEQMHEAVTKEFAACSIGIFAAAVADYRPTEKHAEKIKKNDGNLTVHLEPTVDILQDVANAKGDKFIVGFAAETTDVGQNARKKLTAKNVDLIVANDVTAEGAGFDHNTNVVSLYFRDGRDVALPKMSKIEVAQRVLHEIVRLRGALRTKPAKRLSLV